MYTTAGKAPPAPAHVIAPKAGNPQARSKQRTAVKPKSFIGHSPSIASSSHGRCFAQLFDGPGKRAADFFQIPSGFLRKERNGGVSCGRWHAPQMFRIEWPFSALERTAGPFQDADGWPTMLAGGVGGGGP